ncbi:MAG: MBL fold metallo-hydrolase [Clostridia bacterium]|nr:MBL fold metallo-hydrolase [Clostridia bacterium]
MEIINLGVTLFNNYLLKFEKGCVLLDAGYTTDYPTFLKKIEKAGVKIEDIKYLVLTHVHNDHIGYMKDLLENTSIVPILHEEAEGRLLEGKNRLGDCSGFLSRCLSFLSKVSGKSGETWEPITLDDRKVYANKDNDYLKKQGFPLTIVELPGHTPDNIGLLTDEGSLFSGDMTINGFPARHRKTFLIENLEEYKTSWKKIIDLNPHTIIPCHGKKFPISDMKKYHGKVETIKLWNNK